MGTTKVKLGFLAYKDIPSSTIAALLPLKEDYHSFAWKEEAGLIWYMKVSKWMNEQWEELLEALDKNIPEKGDYKAFSLITSTDVVCHYTTHIHYQTPSQKIIKKDLDLYHLEGLPPVWKTLVEFLTLDFSPAETLNTPATFSFPNPNNSLLLAYLGWQENEATAPIFEQDYKQAAPPTAPIEKIHATNGYPYFCRLVDSIHPIYEALGNLSEENRVVIFEYDKVAMEMLVYLLLPAPTLQYVALGRLLQFPDNK